jgi:hypothetical protein
MTNQREMARHIVGAPDVANACFGPAPSAKEATDAIDSEGFFSNKCW